jgi:hypothetical protein
MGTARVHGGDWKITGLLMAFASRKAFDQRSLAGGGLEVTEGLKKMILPSGY